MSAAGPIPATPEPLIARDAEVARLAKVIAGGASALVVGEAGTGKTALVSRAFASLGARSPRIVTVHANSADQGSLRQALAPLVDRHGGADLGETLRRHAGESTVALRIEDAHLLGEDCRRQVGWWMREGDFSVIATMRRAAGSTWPWLELWRNHSVERVDVAAFEQPQVQEYLESVLPGPVSMAVGWRLSLVTAGVPERVAGVTREEVRRGRLRQVDGVWHWSGGALPDTRLMEVVRSDLAVLDDRTRATLELIAELGPVPHPILVDVAPARALENLQHRGLVTTALAHHGPRAGELMTSVMHPLYAETVRLNVSRERSADLFGCVEHLIDDPHLPTDLAPSLVGFGLRSGAPVRDEAVLVAVEQLFRTSLGDAAVPIIDDALRVGVRDQTAVELLLHRALAMRRAGDAGRGSRDLDRADALVKSLGSPAGLAVRALAARADHRHYALDDPEGALQLIARAEATAREAASVGELAAEQAASISDLAIAHALWAGRRGAAQAAALDALESVPLRPGALVLVAPAALGLAQAGRPDAALEIADRFGPALRSAFAESPLPLIMTSMATMLVSHWAGRYTSELAFDPGSASDPDGSWRHFVRGFEAMSAGAWSTAEAELHAYEFSLRDSDPAGLRRYVAAVHALTAAAAGDRGHARDLLEGGESLPVGRWGVLEAEVRLLRLDATIWLGEGGAAEQALALADWAAARGDRRVELEALHRRSLLAARSPRSAAQWAERLGDLADVVDGDRCVLLERHARALLAGDRQMVDVHERELAAIGLWLAPAASAPTASLTAREREIAHLAAGGMSSRAIAERLVVSVRTVDTHLARAYAKFGVHSREELARALRHGTS